MSTAAAPQSTATFSRRLVVLFAVVVVAVGLDAVVGDFGYRPGIRVGEGVIVGAMFTWWGLWRYGPTVEDGGTTSRLYGALLMAAILGASAAWDGSSLFFAGFAIGTAVLEAWARQRRL